MWTVTEPLSPCPFCSGVRIVALDLGGGGGLLQCSSCSAQGPLGQTHAAAVSGWQTRGRPLPRPCRSCGTLYTPRSHLHQYCSPDCRLAAVRQVREEEHRAMEKDRRLRLRQDTRLLKRVQKLEEAMARRQEALQRQWALASG